MLKPRLVICSILMSLLAFCAQAAYANKDVQSGNSKPYGICAGTNFDSQMLDEIGSTHIGWLRKGLSWNRIERTQGHYDWSEYDAFVKEAKSHGYKVMAILLGTAPWAVRDKSLANTKGAHKQVPDPEAWDQFVRAAVTHYHGLVDAWEVGNEPNGPDFFLGSLDDYRDVVLEGACKVIRQIEPKALIVGPALATSKASRRGTMPQLFAPILAHDGAHSVDAFSIHVYGTPMEIMSAGEEARRILQKAGLGNKPLWLTEFGWNTNNISEEAQKEKMQKFLALNQQLHVYDQFFYYRLMDGGSTLTGNPDKHGILRSDHSQKPIVSVF